MRSLHPSTLAQIVVCLAVLINNVPVTEGVSMSMPVSKAAHEKYCSDCGSIINAKAEICPKCGVRQLPAPGIIGVSTPSGKNKIAAAIFALLLGGFGIHKFYLGRIGQGILYVLFCWTLIPALIGFIEGIIYLTMSDQDFEAKYG
jgi:TM2 domain-containing membrane protein YozV